MKFKHAAVTVITSVSLVSGLSGCTAMVGVEKTDSYSLCSHMSMSGLELMAQGVSKDDIIAELNNRGIDPMGLECSNIAIASAQRRADSSESARRDAASAAASASQNNRAPVRTHCRSSFGNTVNCTTY